MRVRRVQFLREHEQDTQRLPTEILTLFGMPTSLIDGCSDNSLLAERAHPCVVPVRKLLPTRATLFLRTDSSGLYAIQNFQALVQQLLPYMVVELMGGRNGKAPMGVH